MRSLSFLILCFGYLPFAQGEVVRLEPKEKSRYEVVGPKGAQPGFAKIQDAIEMARAQGASSDCPAIIVVAAGKYEENLTLYDGIEIEGPDGEPLSLDRIESPSVAIAGNHALPQEGRVILKNLTFQMSQPDLGTNLGFQAGSHSSEKKKPTKTPKGIISPPTERTDPALTNSGGSGELIVTNHSVLVGGPGNTVVSLAVGGSGQVLVGSAGADPSFITPTAGTGLTVTANATTLDYALSTPVSPANGGTGVNNGANTLTWSGASATFTFTGATSVTFPTSGTLATTAQIPTLPVSLANGGTGASLVASNGGIFYSTATAGAILAGTATANQVLLSGMSSAPSWSTATYPATTTANQLLYSSSNNTITGLATANNGVLITSGAGVPSISSTLPAAVQGNITAVGTIATGTWNGSVIGSAFGGTGVNNGTNTLTLAGNLVTSGAFDSTFTMTNTTSVTFPTTGTLATTSQIPTLPLSLANGGTNASLVASNGGIFYSTATAGAILAGTATANQVLLSGMSSAPSWSTATYPATTTANQLLYSSSNNTITGLATANNGVLITSGAGVPSISSTLPAAVQGNITAVGTIATGVWNGTAITVAFGGTGNTTLTAHAVLVGEGTSPIAQVGPGTAGQALLSGGAGADPSYVTPTAGQGLAVTTNSTTLEYALPNTGVLHASGTLATISGADTTAIQLLAAPGSGQMYIVHYIFLNIKNGSTPWTGIGNAWLVYGTTGNDTTNLASQLITNVIQGGTANTNYIAGVSGSIGSDWLGGSVYTSQRVLSASALNQPVSFTCSNAVTAGNGTIDWRIWYSIVSAD